MVSTESSSRVPVRSIFVRPISNQCRKKLVSSLLLLHLFVFLWSADWLTDVFIIFSFIRIGSSHTNRRKVGELGGIVVEKYKFLQESGCKGLYLHQCKLPVRLHSIFFFGYVLNVLQLIIFVYIYVLKFLFYR